MEKWDSIYSGFYSWWVDKLKGEGRSELDFVVKEITGNGPYKRYLEPKKPDGEIEEWFEEDFETVATTYRALRVMEDDALLNEFLIDYRKFLHDKYYFILSNSAESPEIGKAYMTNVGVKILNKTFRGKPYLSRLCVFGREIEESLLLTDEAKALQDKYVGKVTYRSETRRAPCSIMSEEIIESTNDS